MSENKLQAKYVKYDYILDEMINDMTKSIENISNVVAGQIELVNCLEKESNPKFAGFVEQLKTTTEQYNAQIKILNHRLDCAQKVKSMLELVKETSFILSMLLEAFGVANKDAKTFDERETNKEEISEIDTTHLA